MNDKEPTTLTIHSILFYKNMLRKDNSILANLKDIEKSKITEYIYPYNLSRYIYYIEECQNCLNNMFNELTEKENKM